MSTPAPKLRRPRPNPRHRARVMVSRFHGRFCWAIHPEQLTAMRRRLTLANAVLLGALVRLPAATRDGLAAHLAAAALKVLGLEETPAPKPRRTPRSTI